MKNGQWKVNNAKRNGPLSSPVLEGAACGDSSPPAGWHGRGSGDRREVNITLASRGNNPADRWGFCCPAGATAVGRSGCGV